MPEKSSETTEKNDESLEKIIHSNTAVKANSEQFDSFKEVHPVTIKGPDFNAFEKLCKGGNYCQAFDLLDDAKLAIGGQSSKIGRAVQILNEAIEERSKPLPENFLHAEYVSNNCTIFLGFTSNQITTGNREIIRYLIQHKMVDCIVTSCGAIEEDIIKCLGSFYLGEFSYDGASLRKNGLQRYGNIISGNNVYCDFEDFLIPLLDYFLIEQVNEGKTCTISRFIHTLGEIIENEDSFCYWAYKNSIPVYCPGILDGAIGDVLMTHSLRSKQHLFEKCPKLKDLCEISKDYINLDGTADLIKLTKTSIYSPKKAMLILGGSVPKHHINNACLLGGGADYSVNINTGAPYDCSDSGADPDEAVSWGKLKPMSKAVKIHCDASICFSDLVRQTFVKHRMKNL